jgi:hypothetical protein
LKTKNELLFISFYRLGRMGEALTVMKEQLEILKETNVKEDKYAYYSLIFNMFLVCWRSIGKEEEEAKYKK